MLPVFNVFHGTNTVNLVFNVIKMPAKFFKTEPQRICSKCEGPLEENRIGRQYYCKRCQAEISRKTRKKHSELSEDEKKRANARSYLNQYVRRGVIKKQPCQICGNPEVQAHHKDYSKPLEVVWLCKPCHIEMHKTGNDMDFENSVLPPITGRRFTGAGGKCGKCGGSTEDRPGQRYCKKCHNEYMRQFRAKKNEEVKKAMEFYKLHNG